MVAKVFDNGWVRGQILENLDLRWHVQGGMSNYLYDDDGSGPHMRPLLDVSLRTSHEVLVKPVRRREADTQVRWLRDTSLEPPKCAELAPHL